MKGEMGSKPSLEMDSIFSSTDTTQLSPGGGGYLSCSPIHTPVRKGLSSSEVHPFSPNGAAAKINPDKHLRIEPRATVVTGLEAYYTLLLMTLVVVLLFADQSLMAPNMSQMAEYFGFDDSEKDKKLGGDIAIAFFGFGAPSSLIMGYLTDTANRKNLFALVVLVGESACLGTAFVQTYQQLFWMRAVTGIAIGGAMPLIFSTMGDLCPPAHRTNAAAVVGLALGTGQGVGGMVAGFYGSSSQYGWRLPFVIIAVPALFLGVLLALTTKDPPRGGAEVGLQDHLDNGGEYNEKISKTSLKFLCTTPTVLLVFLQGLPGCIPWGTITTYLNDFLHQQKGLTVPESTIVTSLLGLGATFGMIVGGPVGQYLYDRNKVYQPVLMGVTTTLGIFPAVMMLNMEAGVNAFSGAALMVGFMAAITGPNVRAILLNTTSPVSRGTAFGIYNLFDDLGRGLGPAYVAMMIDKMGRHRAFTLSFYMWSFCSVALFSMCFTIDRDEDKVQAQLLEYAIEQTHFELLTTGNHPEGVHHPHLHVHHHHSHRRQSSSGSANGHGKKHHHHHHHGNAKHHNNNGGHHHKHSRQYSDHTAATSRNDSSQISDMGDDDEDNDGHDHDHLEEEEGASSRGRLNSSSSSSGSFISVDGEEIDLEAYSGGNRARTLSSSAAALVRLTSTSISSPASRMSVIERIVGDVERGIKSVVGEGSAHGTPYKRINSGIERVTPHSREGSTHKMNFNATR